MHILYVFCKYCELNLLDVVILNCYYFLYYHIIIVYMQNDIKKEDYYDY